MPWSAGSLQALLMAGMVLAAVILFGPMFSAAIAANRSDLMAVLLATIGSVYGMRLVFSWWHHRNELSKLDHRVVLGLAVLCTSQCFGLVGYGLYRIDETSFRADQDLLEQQRIARSGEIEDSAAEAESTITWLETIRAQVAAHAEGTLLAQRTWLGDYRVTVGQVEFDLEYHYGSRGAPSGWTMRIRSGDRSEGVGIQNGSSKIRRPENGTVPKSMLLEVLAERIAAAKRSRNAHLARDTHRVPPWAFSYQWLMTVLGDDPNYLRPNSAISRTLAVVYAVLKFLYIGIFVSFFVEEARARA